MPSRAGRIHVDDLIRACDAKVRLVSVSSTSFVPGLRTDLDRLGAVCRERGILLLVDGAQSVGIIAHDVGRTPIDALAASTQKGLLGLYGLGFLYCRSTWADRLEPAYLARFGVELGDAHEADVDASGYRLKAGAQRFDLGNYNFPAATAVNESLKLLLDVGINKVEQHVVALARALARGLGQQGFHVWPDPESGEIANIVTIGRSGADAPALDDFHAALVAAGVKLSIRRGLLRFSFHLYNNLDDVARVLAVAEAWIKTEAGARHVRATAETGGSAPT